MSAFYTPSADGWFPSNETTIYYGTLVASYFLADYFADIVAPYVKVSPTDPVDTSKPSFTFMLLEGASFLLLAMAMHYIVYGMMYSDE